MSNMIGVKEVGKQVIIYAKLVIMAGYVIHVIQIIS